MLISCDWCGRAMTRYPSRVKKHNFCCRQCLANFSSREKNPDGYDSLKNYAGMSANMTRINRRLNPTRMTDTVREKLRQSRLKNGKHKFYPKIYGRHAHRVIAELMLGRPLKKGEVVHHIDENRDNNDPNNLMIFESQAAHAAWHAAIRGGDAK